MYFVGKKDMGSEIVGAPSPTQPPLTRGGGGGGGHWIRTVRSHYLVFHVDKYESWYTSSTIRASLRLLAGYSFFYIFISWCSAIYSSTAIPTVQWVQVCVFISCVH